MTITTSIRSLYIAVPLCMGALAAPVHAANVFDDEALNSAIGERRSGEVYRAIAALQDMMEEVPDADRVKLELALAYMQAGIYDEAERLAGEVAESEDLPEAVAKNVGDFLALVGQQQSAAEENSSKFSYEIAFFGGEDDNVNHGLGTDVLESGVAVPPELRGQSDEFIGFKGTISHVKKDTSSGTFFGKPSMSSWETQAYLYQKGHEDAGGLDVTLISFGTGPVLRVSNGLKLEAKLRVDYIRLGGNELATFYSISPEASIPLGPGNVELEGIVQAREYVSGDNADRQGQHYGGAIGYSLPLWWGMDVSASYFGYTQTADASNLEHDADGYKVNWRWRPIHPLKIYAQFMQKDSDYSGVEPLIGAARKTEEDRLTVGVQYAIQKWQLGLQYLDVDVEANGDAFEYDRKEWMASAALQFD